MRPPFPGMDPWLEDPRLWPNVHKSLVIAIRDDLARRLRPRYFVGVASRRTLLIGADIDRVYQPEVSPQHARRRRISRKQGVEVPRQTEAEPERCEESEEIFLAIRERSASIALCPTVIEILSLATKRAKGPRLEYLQWRHGYHYQAGSNLVEIDLLRGGDAIPMISDSPPNDYRILVSRAKPRRKDTVYTFALTSPIPRIPIPLLPGEPEPIVDLNSLLHKLYERAGYDLVIDYRRGPNPPLRKEDQAWAAAIIAPARAQSPQTPPGGKPSS